MVSDPDRLSKVAFIGIGAGGVSMLESWLDMLPGDALCIALDRDEKYFHRKKKFKHKLALCNVKSEGSSVEYSESVRAEVEKSVDDKMSGLTAMLQSRNHVVLLAGLGGVIGTWASQIICNRLIAIDKQVVTVLVMPFGFENERMKVAEHALPSFDGTAHRVLCFNDYLIKHTPENTSMADAFDIMNAKAFELLGVRE
ncbi:MAG: hypothetical protein R8K49_04370 [Mariprofundaceae bacterium]